MATSGDFSAVLSAGELQNILAAAFPFGDVPTVHEVTATGVILRRSTGEEHGRPGGTVAGPSMMSLADATAWMAILSRIGPVVLVVTTSFHIDFLRKPPLREMWAEGVLLKIGSRLAVVEVALRSEESATLVAKAQVTYSIPPSPNKALAT